MKKILCLLGAIALGGCVNTQSIPVQGDAFTALQGGPLTTVTYKKADFAAMTYGRVGIIGGLVGGLVMISEGNKVIAKNDVPDPAQKIVATLSPALSAKLNVTETKVIEGRDGDSEAILAKDAGNKGLILDVQTINWSFIYYPLDWTHYRVVYLARARLIDARSGKLIAQAPCSYRSDDKNPPNYDQMLDNKAAVLKKMLADAGDFCAAKMGTALLEP